MTTICAAGDHFVRPADFISAIRLATGPDRSLNFRELSLPWPLEPFGDVENVHEASDRVDDLITALHGVEIAVTQMAPFTQRVFDSCPDLRMIGVCRGGPVNVDLEAATRAGVVVTNAPGRNAQAAAEYTIALMLAAMRHVSHADAELHQGRWRGDYYTYENSGLELDGATVGLVGLGAISRIVARVLMAFGATVVAHDPFADALDGVEMVDLDTLLDRSIVVSLHARLTPDSQHLLNADRLLRMRRGAVLVNTARGGLMDYEPLPAMLHSGHLSAVALDVYDVEPPPPSWPLMSAPNVLMSPHLAGATQQTAERAAAIVAEDVARFLRGASCLNVVNGELTGSTS